VHAARRSSVRAAGGVLLLTASQYDVMNLNHTKEWGGRAEAVATREGSSFTLTSL
jgi:hypothetical protein